MKTIANRIALRMMQVVMEQRNHDPISVSTDLDALALPADPPHHVEHVFARDLSRKTLAHLRDNERDMLQRVFTGQDNQQICAGMGLTPTQCRNLKLRAKQRFITCARDLTGVPAAAALDRPQRMPPQKATSSGSMLPQSHRQRSKLASAHAQA